MHTVGNGGTRLTHGFNGTDLVVFVILAVAATVAFGSMLHAYFVSDDFVLLYTVSLQPGLARILGSNWLLERHQGGFYRPLTLLSWSVDYAVAGLDPYWYYLTNLLLHIAVGFLVHRLTLQLTGSRLNAALTALFFILHPVHTEAVAWISGRTDLLCAFFYLLAAVLLAASFHSRLAFGLVLLSGISFWLALMSKEMAATFPAVALLILLCGSARTLPPSRRLLVLLGYILTLVLFILVRSSIVGGIGGYGAAKHLRFDGVILDYLRFYLGWLITPLAMGGHAGFPWFIVYLGTALLVVCLIFQRRYRLGVLWVLVTVLPVLNICRPQYLYIPSVGFTMVVALALTSALTSRSGRVMGFVTVLVLGGFYLVETRLQVDEWRHTGGVALGCKRMLMSHHPVLPAGTTVVLENPPVNRRIPIGVFQNGLREAFRLWYADQSLEARIGQVGVPVAGIGEKTLYIRFDGDRFLEVTRDYHGAERRVRLGPEGEPIRISPATPRTAMAGSATIPAVALEFWSQAANSNELEQGFPLLQVDVTTGEGLHMTLQMHAGIETGEWAYDRPDVKAVIRQSRPVIAYSTISDTRDPELFPTHVYRCRMEFDEAVTVAEVVFSYIRRPESEHRRTCIEIRDVFACIEGETRESTSEDSIDPSQLQR
ncbi:hypothetical protein JW905_13420 [bacterium]|nr:hypothetical protein [candidate division CSSED10-310 bacterium]